jgi:hypothetical protein
MAEESWQERSYALEKLDLDKVTGDSSVFRRGIAEARITLQVAQIAYDARTNADPRRQLADLLGSRPSVIAMLESAGQEGNPLASDSRRSEAPTSDPRAEARSAGRYAAASATPNSTSTVPPRIAGSDGFSR